MWVFGNKFEQKNSYFTSVIIFEHCSPGSLWEEQVVQYIWLSSLRKIWQSVTWKRLFNKTVMAKGLNRKQVSKLESHPSSSSILYILTTRSSIHPEPSCSACLLNSIASLNCTSIIFKLPLLAGMSLRIALDLSDYNIMLIFVQSRRPTIYNYLSPILISPC
jgi:hypothetical protein